MVDVPVLLADAISWTMRRVRKPPHCLAAKRAAELGAPIGMTTRSPSRC
jgi:hypothetical protein